MNEEVRRAISLIPAELLRLAAESADVRAAIGQIMQLPAATLLAMQSPAVLDAIARLQAGARVIQLYLDPIGDEGARALAAALRNNTTLTDLELYGNNIGIEGAQALAAALMDNATLTDLHLGRNNIGIEGAQALAAALRNNATLTDLGLDENNIGDGGAQALAAALTRNATLTSLLISENGVGIEGAQALATALRNNATLTSLNLEQNNIGDEGAQALAAALRNNATLTSLNLEQNNIGDEGARALAAALDTNRTLLYLRPLGDNEFDRLRLNRIIARMPGWVASAVARLWDPKFRIPPDLAARAAMLAFGDELLNVESRNINGLWRSPGGRKFAADYLMPRAEDALRAELARGFL